MLLIKGTLFDVHIFIIQVVFSVNHIQNKITYFIDKKTY